MLGTKAVEVTERHYFKQKPTRAEVEALARLLPGGIRDLFSTRSRRYRELGLAGEQLTDEELTGLLAEEPGLWRRPVVVRGDRAVVGFDPERIEALLS